MKLRIFCAALLIFPSLAMACVNTRNGDFCTSYKDFTQKSWDHELNLTRTYNSRAAEIGWFGYGWGSTFETRMTVMPDGSVVVQENGTGQISYYNQGSNLQDGVDKIVAMAIQRDKLDTESAEVLRKNLLADEKLRRTNVAKYGIQTQLPIGGVAQSSDCAAATITRINEEYRRNTCGKGVDYFDLSGRLIRQEDDGYKINIHYVGKYPDRIDDSLGQKILLKWTAAGHVAEVSTNKPEPIMGYSYDEQDNLLASKQRDGNSYRYEYDGNHNLTRIVTDNTQMDMQYDVNDRVASVVETNGAKATYTYRYDPDTPASHFFTTITRIRTTGEQSSRENEFLLTTDAAGIEKLARLTKVEGKQKEDIELDEYGRLKRVQKFGGEIFEYFYNPAIGKLSAYVTDNGSSVFQYSKAGDLIRAYNSNGTLIKLDYDSHRRVSRMVEINKTRHTRRELTFKYNALGKPIKIKLIGNGEINVKYDEQGEIAKVESGQGAKMALEVTMAFQTLLQVAKVESADLCM